MAVITEYRVISDSEGWITEYGDRESARKRAEQLNQETGVPDDHYVEQVDEVF